MSFYINISTDDAVRLNTILYNTYVCKDGQYIFPFKEGASEYIDVTKNVFYVDAIMRGATTDEQILPDDRDFISSLLVGEKTYEEALALGWIHSSI